MYNAVELVSEDVVMSVKSPPEILSQEVVASSKIFSIEQVHLRFSNGEERIYERFLSRNRGAVMILPFLNDNTILMIREYAVGMEDYELTLPKGLIDPGETFEEAANRELKEEVGYGAKRIAPLRSFSMSPGHGRASMHCFVAEDLYPERLEGDEPESLEVIEVSFDDLSEIIQREDVNDARTIATLLYYQQLHR